MPPVNVTSSDNDVFPETDDPALNLQLAIICRNLTIALDKLKPSRGGDHDDSANAFLYIVFVLMFYACSIVILMVKYIKREREGVKLEYYYDEFVKREAFQYRLFDKTGRLIPLPPPDSNEVPSILIAKKSTEVVIEEEVDDEVSKIDNLTFDESKLSKVFNETNV